MRSESVKFARHLPRELRGVRGAGQGGKDFTWFRNYFLPRFLDDLRIQ